LITIISQTDFGQFYAVID